MTTTPSSNTPYQPAHDEREHISLSRRLRRTKRRLLLEHMTGPGQSLSETSTSTNKETTVPPTPEPNVNKQLELILARIESRRGRGVATARHLRVPQFVARE